MSYTAYTALAALFLLSCALVGVFAGDRAQRSWVAASLAAAMVAVQFVVVVLR